MTPRRIDDKYFVSPQIDVTDMSDIAKAELNWPSAIVPMKKSHRITRRRHEDRRRGRRT